MMSNDGTVATSKGGDVALSDEEMRKLLKPNPSKEQVLVALQRSFAEPGQEIKFVKDLESYDDRNYWIEIDGKPFLAKIHNGVESSEFIKLASKGETNKSAIHLQNAMMKHLNDAGISTSSPQEPIKNEFSTPASVHSLPVVSKEHSPCKLVIRVLGWVQGITMASARMLPLESLAETGRYLGRLALKLSELDCNTLAAAKRFHQWDGKNTLGLKDFVNYIKEPRRKELVESVLQAFQRNLIDTKVADSFKKSLIHGDVNDANLLLDSNYFVSGVIDFGDSVESWRILDLSVAMAYAMLSVYAKTNRSISAAAAVLRGYNSVCPLTEQELKHLILLVACRLSCSVTLGAYSYQQNPENEYLLLHALPAWQALDLIWGTDEARREETAKVVNGIFALACSAQIDPEADVVMCSDLSFPDPIVGDPMKDLRSTLVDGVGRPTKRRRSTFI